MESKAEKVLIVDDDNIVAKLVAAKLHKDLEIAAEIANSLSQTKTLIREKRKDFGLAILDYNLPDAPEGEVIDYVQSKGIPSIVLTASFDPNVRDSVLAKNVVDYVIKKDKNELEYLVNEVRRIFKNKDVKVLIVDDSSVYRKTMTNILSNQLLDVFEAKNGSEALRIIEKNTDIKIVISDVDMPVMDGFSLLTHIRKKYRKDQMIVIIASGMVGTEAMPRFLKAGANDYLMKPFTNEEFVCRINTNLESLQMIEELNTLVFKDPLTGIYNRRYLFNVGQIILANAVRNDSNLAAIMLDIDNFKKINDTFGHECGDLVLKNLGHTLDVFFKRDTDIVARIGGEEFCVISSSYKKTDNILKFVEKIRKNIESQTIEYNKHKIRYTVSIGICTSIQFTFDAMLKIADDMLYKAKTQGKNCSCNV